MTSADNIFLRRQILDWRDKHTEKIDRHLKKEVIFLYNKIDFIINKMSLKDIIKNETLTKKVQGIFNQWLEDELCLLFTEAKTDLNNIYQHQFENIDTRKDKLNYSDNNEIIRDIATATISSGAAIFVIPRIATLFTSTVAAPGILGTLGLATTTVINWPLILAGLTVISAVSVLKKNDSTNFKTKAINRYKTAVRKMIYEKAIHNKNNNSVSQSLQIKIEDTANLLLRELIV